MPSLIFNYGNWQFWSVYDTANELYGTQNVTFDGPNKIIIVNEGITEIDFREDVYSNWKEWLHDPTQDNEKYLPAISVVGGDPLPGDRVLGTTYFLENGWRMRTWEGDHSLTVTGNVFTREGDPLFVPTLNPWTITINLNTSSLVETILPDIAIDATTIEGIADAVWAEVLSGTAAGTRLTNIPLDVWSEYVDAASTITAKEKLDKIATKTQDIALR